MDFGWPKDEYGFKKQVSEWTPDEQRRYEEHQQQQREQGKRRAEEERRKKDEKQKKIDEYKERIQPILERFVSRSGSPGALKVKGFPEHWVGPFWRSGGYEWTLLGGDGTVKFQPDATSPIYINVSIERRIVRDEQKWKELGRVLEQHTGLEVFVWLEGGSSILFSWGAFRRKLVRPSVSSTLMQAETNTGCVFTPKALGQ